MKKTDDATQKHLLQKTRRVENKTETETKTNANRTAGMSSREQVQPDASTDGGNVVIRGDENCFQSAGRSCLDGSSKKHVLKQIPCWTVECRFCSILNKVLLLVPLILATVDVFMDTKTMLEFYHRDKAGLVHGAVDKLKINWIFGLCMFAIALIFFYFITYCIYLKLNCESSNNVALSTHAKLDAPPPGNPTSEDHTNQVIGDSARPVDHTNQVAGDFARAKEHTTQVAGDSARPKDHTSQVAAKATSFEEENLKLYLCFYVIQFLLIFEDVAEDFIWIYIYTCYERYDSSWLKSKTILQITSAILRTAWTMIKLSLRKSIRRRGCLCLLEILGWLILFGVVSQLALSSILYYLDQVYTQKVDWRSFQSSYHPVPYYVNRDQYLHDVSIFINRAGEPAAWLRQDSSNEWMRLFYIESIIQKTQLYFKFKYHTDTIGNVNMAVWTKEERVEVDWKLTGCYSINQFIEPKWPYPADLLNSPETYFMKFQFVANSSYTVGQIVFNMKVEESGTLKDWNTFTSARNITRHYSSMFHYFRHWPNSENFLHHKLSNKTTFYHNNTHELTDVRGIWKTGTGSCKCTATLWPVFDPNLDFSIE